ncbi:MAG: DUF3566 domain-containing protein [Ilumatobacteraceae bacterium]
MSKTERVLAGDDEAALDELDEFVASEAEAADTAIGELIDDVVDERSNGDGPASDHSGNGSDAVETERPDAATDTPAGRNGLDTGETERPDDVASAEADEPSTAVATAVAAPVTEDEVAEDVVADADDAVETDGSGEQDSYALPAIIPATSDDPDAEEGDETGESGEIEAREGDEEPVSDDIIEELRRADIDGPMVEFAPQDDTSTARRRPKRRPDYDPAPIPIPAKPPRVLGRKPRVRKVTRVVRHVDPWSVFKIAAVANLVLYIVLLVAGVLLWNVAYATGTIDNVERFFESFGWSSFEFNGGEIYHSAWIAGLFAAIGLTGLAVLLATMFNLITDIVGGMRFTVLEEEVVETRTSPMRRFVVRRPEPVVPAETEDSTGSLVREGVVDDSNAIERRTR